MAWKASLPGLPLQIPSKGRRRMPTSPFRPGETATVAILDLVDLVQRGAGYLPRRAEGSVLLDA